MKKYAEASDVTANTATAEKVYYALLVPQNGVTDFLVTRTLVLRAYKPHGPYEKGMTWTIPEHDLDS